MFAFSSLHRPLRRLAALAVLTVVARLGALDAVPAVPARGFATPEEAVKALLTATQAGDRAAVDAILGSGVQELLSGDAKQDALEFAAFAKLTAQYFLLARLADDRCVLNLGEQNWPFPIPLVKHGATWSFDTAAGKEEILNRRIGEDELNAIGVCRTYLAAQREYAAEDRNHDGIFAYAQHLRSTPGQQDGLYWPVAEGEEPSPFGPLVAEVHAAGYGGKTAEGEPQPFKGYRFKVLTAQGAAAPAGAYDYVINGHLIGGFALIAYPAHWGESGIMTFIVNQWGRVYERNLGADSAALASATTEFDPDDGWQAVPLP
jgi:hypothetical protein